MKEEWNCNLKEFATEIWYYLKGKSFYFEIFLKAMNKARDSKREELTHYKRAKIKLFKKARVLK